MSAPAAEVLLDVVDGAATVTLNRAAKLNAVTLGMVRRLSELLQAADADAQVRVVELTGRCRTIGADEALRIGLVSEIAEQEQVLDHATGYARDLSRRCSPCSLEVIKQLLRSASRADYQSAFYRSLRLTVESFSGPGPKEALDAAHAVRSPQLPPLDPDR